MLSPRGAQSVTVILSQCETLRQSDVSALKRAQRRKAVDIKSWIQTGLLMAPTWAWETGWGAEQELMKDIPVVGNHLVSWPKLCAQQMKEWPGQVVGLVYRETTVLKVVLAPKTFCHCTEAVWIWILISAYRANTLRIIMICGAPGYLTIYIFLKAKAYA